MANKKILIVDADEKSRNFLKDILEGSFQVISVQAGEQAFESARTQFPDLVLLGISDRKTDGIEICQVLRNHERTRHLPVIAIANAEDFDLGLKALEVGADDLLYKPFRFRDLLVRIQNKIQRHEEKMPSKTHLQIEDLELCLDRFECKIKGKDATLSFLEFKLLRYFVENFGRLLSREKILQAVWQRPDGVSPRTVDTHMTSLRKRLKSSNLSITTLYGAGYILKEKTFPHHPTN